MYERVRRGACVCVCVGGGAFLLPDCVPSAHKEDNLLEEKKKTLMPSHFSFYSPNPTTL